MALTKAQIQQRLREGTSHVEYVDAPELGGPDAPDLDGAELAVRPLTQGEIDQVNTVMLKGQSFTGTPDGDEVVNGITFDLGQSAEAQSHSNRMKVAFGLSVGGEAWSPKEAGALPPKLFKRVLDKVQEISDDDAFVTDAEMFRGDPSGGDDGAAGDVGDTAGGDTG